jgi:hypothetical protein
MTGRQCVRFNADASCAQYGDTPGPPIGTPTAGPPLPRTGHDAAVEAFAGGFMMTVGVVLLVIVRRWPK